MNTITTTISIQTEKEQFSALLNGTGNVVRHLDSLRYLHELLQQLSPADFEKVFALLKNMQHPLSGKLDAEIIGTTLHYTCLWKMNQRHMFSNSDYILRRKYPRPLHDAIDLDMLPTVRYGIYWLYEQFCKRHLPGEKPISPRKFIRLLRQYAQEPLESVSFIIEKRHGMTVIKKIFKAEER